jgi:serine/threonine-protein kinase
MPVIQKVNIGKYRVTGLIGVGGMGEVYRAVDDRLGRTVAIKVLNQSRAEPQQMSRFLDEARIQATLIHPNIATLYDWLEHEGRSCLVMEYVDGETLAKRIQSRGALPGAEAIAIFDSVTAAVSYLHSRGIVHRDIKSDNIQIASTSTVKLLDFGIARSSYAPRRTVPGQLVGTFEYAAPELFDGVEPGSAADIWALGVLLYEMLAGRLPFEGGSVAELCGKISRLDYVPLAKVNERVPRALEMIVSRCLAKRPADRCPSVDVLRRDLDHFRRVQTPAPARIAVARPRLFSWVSMSIRVRIAVGAMVLLAAGLSFTHVRKAPISEATGMVKSIAIESVGGPADVYRDDGQRLGKTPVSIQARIGDRIRLTLKRTGSVDLPVDFDVSERTAYTYTMEPAEK